MKIAVLMSTYNGEKYLKDQIDSILAQKLCAGCELTLLIRDDGSADQTREIIKIFVKQKKNVTCMNISDPSHIGIKGSFLLLLRTALAAEQQFDYFAFADQDDVWLEDKLASAIDRLEGSDNKKGALYYSNKFIADEKLQVKEKDNILYYGDFIEVLWGSQAYGNTMVFNNTLAEYADRHQSQISKYHDAWIYRLAKCIGSDIYFDENAYIYYRQHSENIVGFSHGFHENWLYLIKNFFPNLVRPREHFSQKQIKEIVEYYQEELDPKVIGYIERVMGYNENFKFKWALLRDRNMKKRPFLNRCIWTYKVLFNMI